MEKKKNIFKEAFKAVCRAIVTTTIYIYCKIVYRAKIIGKENIPKEGALVFCGNHRTYLDPPLIVVTASRKMSFIAKEELRKNLLFRFLVFAYDGIYVKRDSKDIGPMKEALKILKNGGCIGIFPEGTRNGMEKNEGGKLKNGAAYLSLKTNAKIIPIGIKGEPKPFHRVTITYGKPMDFSELLKDKKAKELEDYVSEQLKDEIIRLSE